MEYETFSCCKKAEVEINIAWETIRENIKISAKESLSYFEIKKKKPWFDKDYSKLLDQRKQATVATNPKEINGYNLNNTRCEAKQTLQEHKEGISERQN
jgi:hypothetical protein